MTWTTPDFEQISTSCEINSYAPAMAEFGIPC
jgi:coenzyme PQQ precursor peptide PqqA